MTGTPRTPTFLAGLHGPDAAVRPAPFAVQAPAGARARPVLTHGDDLAQPHAAPPPEPPPPAPEPPPPPPAGPTPEQLAAVRAEAMQNVAHAVEVLRLTAERLAEQARADALEIGFRVARRVLEAELSSSPDALFALVRTALKRAGDSRRIAVHVHPSDAQALAPALAEGGLGVSTATVELVPDASLSPGDCTVDTDFGKIDGRLDTRLDELHRAALAAAEEAKS